MDDFTGYFGHKGKRGRGRKAGMGQSKKEKLDKEKFVENEGQRE